MTPSSMYGIKLNAIMFRYNIKFGDPTASDEEIFEAAKAAQIHEKIITLPEGLLLFDFFETMFRLRYYGRRKRFEIIRW